MFFGTTTFAQSTFSDVGNNQVNPIVVVAGSQINVAIGNIGPIPDVLIVPTGLGTNRPRRIGELWHQVHQVI